MSVNLEEAYNGGLREFVIDVPDASGRPTRERIEVKIPPGVRDGTRLRVAGKGHPGFNNGPRGDLYLRIRLAPHERLERRGDDLHADVPVPLLDAILGGRWRSRPSPGGGRSASPRRRRTGRPSASPGRACPRWAAGARATSTPGSRWCCRSKLTDGERDLFQELRKLRPEGQ